MATVPSIPEHIPSAQVFDFDIYADTRISDDVQGSYSAALKGAPDVFWTPRNGGHWMVKRADIITDIVKDNATFSVREMQIPRVPNPPFFIPLSMDFPTNTRYRMALMPKFSAKAINELEPKIRQWAVEIIESVIAKGECDFISDVASQFPVSVFMELMGLPLEKLREFRAIADTFFKARTEEEFAAATGQIMGIFQELIALRSAQPENDLLSHLLTIEIEGAKMSTEEVLAMCFVLFLGGMDTVTNVTGFSFQYLAQDLALQVRLATDAALIPKFVDEGLRCFGVINTPRLVTQDVERFGIKFREGEMVLCLLPMAGRDDRVNPDPDKFDIDRPKAAHMIFSTGPHLCIGHILARAEIRVLTEEWFKRVPHFAPKLGLRHGFRIGTVQAIESLPIQWSVSA